MAWVLDSEQFEFFGFMAFVQNRGFGFSTIWLIKLSFSWVYCPISRKTDPYDQPLKA
jgi:hypothetical protein